jgi:hypothetical protein
VLMVMFLNWWSAIDFLRWQCRCKAGDDNDTLVMGQVGRDWNLGKIARAWWGNIRGVNKNCHKKKYDECVDMSGSFQ